MYPVVKRRISSLTSQDIRFHLFWLFLFEIY